MYHKKSSGDQVVVLDLMRPNPSSIGLHVATTSEAIYETLVQGSIRGERYAHMEERRIGALPLTSKEDCAGEILLVGDRLPEVAACTKCNQQFELLPNLITSCDDRLSWALAFLHAIHGLSEWQELCGIIETIRTIRRHEDHRYIFSPPVTITFIRGMLNDNPNTDGFKDSLILPVVNLFLNQKVAVRSTLFKEGDDPATVMAGITYSLLGALEEGVFERLRPPW